MSTATDNSEVVLMVMLEFQPEHKEEFMNGLRKTLEHVTQNEPGTLAYHVYVDKTNPNILYLYERYLNEHAWHEVHEKSAPFLEWAATWKQSLKNVQIQTMTEMGLGFLTR